MVIIFKYILPSKYNGLAVFPFIFLRNKTLINDKKLINHEKIHLKQQVELLWVFFFTWYIIEFFIRTIKYQNSYTAYKNISFEKEAYINESDLNYLKKRKLFSFLNYLK